MLAGAAATASAAPSAAMPGAAEFIYTVRPGDHAWNIAERFLSDRRHWHDLRQLNRLADDRLRPGRVLRIPLPWLRLVTQEARIVQVSGPVTLQRPDRRAETAQPGTVLPPGAWLRTPGQGSALLQMSDGSRVLVRPDSELRLLPLDAGQMAALTQATEPAPRPASAASASPPMRPAVRIELLRGGLENIVQPQAGPTRFEVRTPSAITVVRGTAFRIAADEQGSRTEVEHGRVEVRAPGDGGPTVDVGQARGSRTERGQPPRPAVPLLPAPDLASLPARLSPAGVLAALAPAQPGAVAYRLQWLDDRDEPPRLISDEVTEQPRLARQAPADGPYRVRLRAIDADGLEGLSAEHALTIATPEVPRAVLPPPDGWMPSGRPLMQWTVAEGVQAYRVQVGQDAGFSRLVAQADVDLAQWQAPRLPPGAYHWRVAGVEHLPDGQTRTGPFTPSRRLNVPWGPPVLEGARLDDRLRLNWTEGEPGACVQLQIARDDDFRDVLLDEPVHGTATSLPRPPRPGRYLARIRALTADGGTSEWSGPLAIDVGAAR